MNKRVILIFALVACAAASAFAQGAPDAAGSAAMWKYLSAAIAVGLWLAVRQGY